MHLNNILTRLPLCASCPLASGTFISNSEYNRAHNSLIGNIKSQRLIKEHSPIFPLTCEMEHYLSQHGVFSQMASGITFYSPFIYAEGSFSIQALQSYKRIRLLILLVVLNCTALLCTVNTNPIEGPRMVERKHGLCGKPNLEWLKQWTLIVSQPIERE